MSKASILLDSPSTEEREKEIGGSIVSFTVRAAVGDIPSDLTDEVLIDLVKDECNVDVRVTSRSSKCIECQCLEVAFTALPTSFSHDCEELIIKMKPDKSKVVLYFIAEVGTIQCSPHDILKKITRDFKKVTISPLDCQVNSNEWTFACPLEDFAILNKNGKKLLIIIKGQKIYCDPERSLPKKFVFKVIVSDPNDEFPDDLTEEMMIDVLRDDDPTLAVEVKRIDRGFMCTCDEDVKDLIREEYSYQSTYLLVEKGDSYEGDRTKSTVKQEKSSSEDKIVSSTENVMSGQLRGDIDKFLKKMDMAAAAFNYEKKNSKLSLVEDYGSLLMHHAAHSELQYSFFTVFCEDYSQFIPFEAYEKISVILLDPQEVSEYLEAMLKRCEEENFHFVSGQIQSLQNKWSHFLSKVTPMEDDFIFNLISLQKVANIPVSATYSSQCVAITNWPKLKSLNDHLLEVFKNDQKKISLLVDLKLVLNVLLKISSLSLDIFKAISSICADVMKEIRPVSLMHIIRLLTRCEIKTYSGKNLIVFLGSSGVGKSTFMFFVNGITFECTFNEATKKFHKPIVPKDPILKKRLEDLYRAGIRNSPSDTSETSDVISIMYDIDGVEYYILDTPGFFDTRGDVFNILNGYRIWKAIQGANIVYPVFLLDNTDLRKGDAASIKKYQTYSDILSANESNLSKCSFVMTRLDVSSKMRENLYNEFKILPDNIRESCGNESASVFCKVFAEKLSRPPNKIDAITDGEAYILDLDNDIGEIYLRSFVRTNGIRDTYDEQASFSDCISEDGHRALRAQLKVMNKSLEYSLNIGDMSVACRRFQDMQLWVQTLDIHDTKAAYHESLKITDRVVGRNITLIETVSTKDSVNQNEIYELVNAVIVIHSVLETVLASHASIFQEKQSFCASYIDILSSFFKKISGIPIELEYESKLVYAQSVVQSLLLMRDGFLKVLAVDSAIVFKITEAIKDISTKIANKMALFIAYFKNNIKEPVNLLNCYNLLKRKNSLLKLFDLAFDNIDESYKPMERIFEVEGDGNNNASFLEQFEEAVSNLCTECLSMNWNVPVNLDKLSSFRKTFESLCELRKALGSDCTAYLPKCKLPECIEKIFANIKSYVSSIGTIMINSNNIREISMNSCSSSLSSLEILSIFESRFQGVLKNSGETIADTLRNVTSHLMNLCSTVNDKFRADSLIVLQESNLSEFRVEAYENDAAILCRSSFIHNEFHESAQKLCIEYVSHIWNACMKNVASMSLVRLASQRYRCIIFRSAVKLLANDLPLESLKPFHEKCDNVERAFDNVFEKQYSIVSEFYSNLRSCKDFVNQSGIQDIFEYGKNYIACKCFLEDCSSIMWSLPETRPTSIVIVLDECVLPSQKVIQDLIDIQKNEEVNIIETTKIYIKQSAEFLYDDNYLRNLQSDTNLPSKTSFQNFRTAMLYVKYLGLQKLYIEVIGKIVTLSDGISQFAETVNINIVNKVIEICQELKAFDKDLEANKKPIFENLIDRLSASQVKNLRKKAKCLQRGDFGNLKTMLASGDDDGDESGDTEIENSFKTLISTHSDRSMWAKLCKYRNGLTYLEEYVQGDILDRLERQFLDFVGDSKSPLVSNGSLIANFHDNRRKIIKECIDRGEFMNAFHNILELKKLLLSYSPVLGVPVNQSSQAKNALPCVHCSNAITFHENASEIVCLRCNPNFRQFVYNKSNANDAISGLHQKVEKLCTDMQILLTSKVNYLLNYVERLSEGEDDYFSLDTMDSVSAYSRANSPVNSDKWIFTVINECTEYKAIEVDNLCSLDINQLWSKMCNIRLEISNIFNRGLKDADKLYDIYNKDTIGGRLTKLNMSELTYIRNRVNAMSRTLKVYYDESRKVNPLDDIVTPQMLKKIKDIACDLVEAEKLSNIKFNELLDQDSSIDNIHSADPKLLLAKFEKFKKMVASSFDRGVQDSYMLVIKACDEILKEGKIWVKVYNHDMRSIMDTFLRKRLDPCVDKAMRYYESIKRIADGKGFMTGRNPNDSDIDCGHIECVIYCSQLTNDVKGWFPNYTGIMKVINNVDNVVKIIANYFSERSSEIDRLLKEVLAYVPSKSQSEATIGQMYYVTVPDPSSISSLGKYIRDISLFNINYSYLLEKISNSHKNDSTTLMVEQLKFCQNLSNRVYEVDQGTESLTTYLMKNRSKLEAKDVSGKIKYYSLLYSCQVLTKEVRNDIEKSRTIKEKITRDIELFYVEASNIANTLGAERVNKEEFDKLANTIENLKSIGVACFDDGEEVEVKVSNITAKIKKELEIIKQRLWLSENDWNKYKDKFVIVRDEMIYLKSIGTSLIYLDSDINKMIEEVLKSYKEVRASYNREAHRDFLKLLVNGLKEKGGETIIDDMPSLKPYKNAFRNQEFERVDCDTVLKKMTTIDVKKPINEGKKVEFDLKQMYIEIIDEKYWKLVEKCLSDRKSIELIPDQVRQIAENMKSLDDPKKVAGGINSILAYFFAYWTLNNLDGYDSVEPSGYFIKTNREFLCQPHPGQVFVILRILGLDLPSFYQTNTYSQISKNAGSLWQHLFGSVDHGRPCFSLSNHLAEIKTGEGKSVVLAALACVIAFLGYDVDIACYSQYLSDRDASSFSYIFKDFKISEGFGKISYGTFQSLSVKLLDPQETIRDLITATITGDNEKVLKLQQLSRQSTRYRILLIDEVDVLFSETFYGRLYSILGTIEGKKFPAISKLFDLVWQNKTLTRSDLWVLVTNSQEYAACNAIIPPEWQFLTENAAKTMVLNVLELDEYLKQNPPSKVDSKGIWYFDDNNQLTNKRRDEYKTAFAYMKYNSTDPDKISEELVETVKSFLVDVGSLAYAALPKLYLYSMGVTGTLSTLTNEQKLLLENEYDFTADKTTIMPSAYPEPDTVVNTKYHGKVGTDIFLGFKGSYFHMITSDIDNNLIDPITGYMRPVIVFFKDDKSLSNFEADEAFDTYRGQINKLVTETPPDKISEIVRQAVLPGQITLAIAPFGRGTDFYYINKDLDKAKGIHVCQTFFSETKSEEVQIRGRAGRQGHPGSYAMVLQESDFELIGVDINKEPDDILASFEKCRAKKSMESFAESEKLAQRNRESHNLSAEVLKLLYSNNRNDSAILNEKLKVFNQINVKMETSVSRTMILMDGTYSMDTLFVECKCQVKQIIQRINEILLEKNVTTGFELQFVVYRNYSSGAEDILKVSPWTSDASTLLTFIDKTSVSGGMGNEAIEVALFHVNEQAVDTKGKISQVILVGDAGPNTEDEVTEKRDYVKMKGLKGEAYWATTKYNTPLHYETELDDRHPIKQKNIPIHTNYLATRAKDDFEKITNMTGGTCRELHLDGKDAEDLTHLIAARILDDIDKDNGGSADDSLLKLYLDRYNKSGFVL